MKAKATKKRARAKSIDIGDVVDKVIQLNDHDLRTVQLFVNHLRKGRWPSKAAIERRRATVRTGGAR